MTGITERLRLVSETGCDPDLPHEAADEIDRLRARVAELEEERDAAFRMSRCECGADEACANLVALHRRVAELEAADGICFTAMLVEIDGHAYGLRPGAARVVKEAMRKWGMIPLLLNALQVARDNIDPDLEPDDIALIDAAIDAAKDGA